MTGGGGRPDAGARHRSEFDLVGHEFRDPQGEGSQLLMDVHEEGVRAPATHFPDLNVAAFVEVHCHGAPSPEGVTADVTFVIP